MKTQSLIAINLGHKFVAIKAEIIEIHGFAAGVHKTIGKSGWTVTSVGVGIAFAKSSVSRAEAIQLASDRIERAGAGKVQAQLADLQWAPAVETLEAYAAPVVEKAVPADIDAIVKAIGDTAGLSDNERVAVRQALNSRTGQLKAKSPSAFDGNGLACAAWQAIQCNPYKVSVSACIFLRGEAKELFEKLSKFTWPSCLDKDRHNLEKAGVW